MKFHMSEELAKIMNVCSTGSVWEQNVPLVNRYKRFHESKMIQKTLKLIKKQSGLVKTHNCNTLC